MAMQARDATDEEGAPCVSIVVPVGPGDAAWRGLLPRLAALDTGYEVLLAGTAPPATDDASLSGGARWLSCPSGRARQQNAGAAAARAPLLWFLHCDSRPDQRVLRSVARLPRDFDALGWFPLRFHDGTALHRLNAVGANLRSRICALPFGDQGLLLPAARFRALDGFDESLARGEDLDLVLRARRSGLRLCRLDGTLSTSARRYREHGWWRTTREHLRLTRSLRAEALARLDGVRR